MLGEHQAYDGISGVEAGEPIRIELREATQVGVDEEAEGPMSLCQVSEDMTASGGVGTLGQTVLSADLLEDLDEDELAELEVDEVREAPQRGAADSEPRSVCVSWRCALRLRKQIARYPLPNHPHPPSAPVAARASSQPSSRITSGAR